MVAKPLNSPLNGTIGSQSRRWIWATRERSTSRLWQNSLVVPTEFGAALWIQ